MRMKVWSEISANAISSGRRRRFPDARSSSSMPMAMRIGSTSKIDEVDRDDFLALAKELDVSPRMVRRLIGEVCEGAGGAASAVASDMEDALGAPLPKLREIEAFAQVQIGRLGCSALGAALPATSGTGA